MPLREYFQGKGPEVMKSMTQQYGKKKAKRVFYATANAAKKKKALLRGKEND